MHLKICKLDAEDEVVAQLIAGSHVVGRGPTLMCSDKRISRNHATIDVEKDHATITPIHINPCYHMAANSKSVRILPHQQGTLLQDGDKFGLLPDACWFKVKYDIPDEDCKQIANASSSKRSCDNESDENDCKRLKIEKEPTGLALEGTAGGPSIKEETDEAQMGTNPVQVRPEIAFSEEVAEENNGGIEDIDITEVNDVKDENIGISDGNGISAVKEEEIDIFENEVKQEYAGDNDVNQENIEVKQENTADNEVKQENTADNEVKQENTENKEVKQENSTDNEVKQENATDNEVKQENAIGIEVGQQIQSNEDEPGNENMDPQPSTSSNQESKDEDKSDNTKDTKDQATGTASPKLKREKCWYGASCYRKNPAHRADLRHPGDSDYVSDSEDERPTCIFGARCYRKNKQHRQSYKHPPHQRPPKYGRGQRRRDNGNLANPNDDFLDSDEDDMQGDFSDGSSDNYEPPSDVDSDETDWTSSQDLSSQDHTTGKKTKK